MGQRDTGSDDCVRCAQLTEREETISRRLTEVRTAIDVLTMIHDQSGVDILKLKAFELRIEREKTRESLNEHLRACNLREACTRGRQNDCGTTPIKISGDDE